MPAKASAVIIGWAVSIAAVAAIASAVTAPPTRAAQPTKGAKYEYESIRSGSEARFQVSRRGSSLSDVIMTLFMPCSNGRDGIGLFFGFAEEPPARLPIAPDGTFSGTFSVSEEWLDPFTLSEEYWLSGKFVRRGKAARLTIRSKLVGEGGTVCDTGDRQVTARRAATRAKRSS